MLHMILGILKIISIILLILLGVILFLLLLILFFPLSYRIDGEKNTAIYGRVKVHWLFHLIAFYAYYQENRVSMKLRIFGIPIRLDKEKREKDKKEKKIKPGGRNKTELKAKGKIEESKQEIKAKSVVTIPEEKELLKEDELPEQIKELKSTQSPEKIQDAKEIKAEKESLFTKIKNFILNFIRNIINKIKNIAYTYHKICDKIKELKNSKDMMIEFIKDENNKKAFGLIKEQLKIVFNHIKPKKFLLKLTYGTGDPESTGYILAGFGIAYPIFKNSCQIVPDFENERLEGTVLIKGRMQVFILLWSVFKLYRDKNVKNLINKVQTLRRK